MLARSELTFIHQNTAQVTTSPSHQIVIIHAFPQQAFTSIVFTTFALSPLALSVRGSLPMPSSLSGWKTPLDEDDMYLSSGDSPNPKASRTQSALGPPHNVSDWRDTNLQPILTLLCGLFGICCAYDLTLHCDGSQHLAHYFLDCHPAKRSGLTSLLPRLYDYLPQYCPSETCVSYYLGAAGATCWPG